MIFWTLICKCGCGELIKLPNSDTRFGMEWLPHFKSKEDAERAVGEYEAHERPRVVECSLDLIGVRQ